MYLVEILLVTILLMSYLVYLNPSGSPRESINILARDYEIGTLCSSLSKTVKNDVNINEIGTTNFLIFKKLLKDFSQRIERSEIVKIYYNLSYGCISFLYPFPNIENKDFLLNNSAYFSIWNYEGTQCKFYATRDWILAIINTPLSESNISLDLSSLILKGKNLSNLDVYSVFSFDPYGNQIKISYISYDNKYLNISFSSFPQNQTFPIYIIFRIKENRSYPDLIYLKYYNEYSNISYINGIIIQTMWIDVAKWLTIYLNTSCIRNGYIFVDYYIYPVEAENITNIQNCYSPDMVIYHKNNFFEYYTKDLERVSIVNRPSGLVHTCSILLNNGLSLTSIEIYGS